MKFKFLCSVILLSVASQAGAASNVANLGAYSDLQAAKTLADLKITPAKEAHAGIVCAHKLEDGKFIYIAGKVYHPSLTGTLNTEQHKIFTKFDKAKEGKKVKYTYQKMKKAAFVKKFGTDVICAYVRPEAK